MNLITNQNEYYNTVSNVQKSNYLCFCYSINEFLILFLRGKIKLNEVQNTNLRSKLELYIEKYVNKDDTKNLNLPLKKMPLLIIKKFSDLINEVQSKFKLNKNELFYCELCDEVLFSNEYDGDNDNDLNICSKNERSLYEYKCKNEHITFACMLTRKPIAYSFSCQDVKSNSNSSNAKKKPFNTISSNTNNVINTFLFCDCCYIFYEKNALATFQNDILSNCCIFCQHLLI